MSDNHSVEPFRKVAVLGVGLIGGSLALALKRAALASEIIGVSSRPTIEKALELGVIDRGYERAQTAEAVADCDLVLMCAPVNVVIRQLGEIANDLPDGCIVSDVGSTKRKIVEAAAADLPENIHFVGGHPMAGAETTGVESADPFIFQNAMYVLCPARKSGNGAAKRLADTFTAIGARVLLMDPDNHDRIAATISHLPQMLAVTLMNLAADHNEADANTLKLAAGGFRDLTRIASSPYEMWHDIIETNGDSISGLIDEFIEKLIDLRWSICGDSIEESFTRAAASRALIHKNAKGFLSPLYELVVTAPDEVGVIQKIANGLADEGINIKDIEVLKVREGEGGTIMLGLSTEEDRNKAKQILNSAGLPSRNRT